MEPADLFAAIVENSDAAIIAKDLDGTVLSWNPAAELIFGWTPEEMIGQPLRRIIPADRQEEEDHILDLIKRGESVARFETVRTGKDGSEVPIAVLVSPVRDPSGAVIGARICNSAVKSRTILLAPMTAPDGSRTGETSTAIGTLLPSLPSRTVSNRATLSPRLIRSRI